MFRGKKEEGVNWAFLQEHYPDVVEGLKELREWDNVKNALADAERLEDYSILALAALVALKREVNIDLEELSERIYNVSNKLDSFKTETENNFKRIEKEINGIKEVVEELDRRTVVVANVEKVLPRVSELEERMLSFPIEVAESLEKRLIKSLEKKVEELVEEKVGKANNINLKEFLDKYDSLVRENVELKRKLENRERIIRELRDKLAKMQESVKEVEEIEKKVSEYGKLAEDMKEVRVRLAKITGSYDLKEALRIIENNFIPKSRVEELAKSIKNLMKENEELRKENEKLKKDLERITQAVKTLVDEGLIEPPQEEE
ncbi:hypothetical protein [Pyrococcus horikoshii]|uniref:Uncharacterized protein n=2 Tax=Pyrococcus horikoshii TaxID=53953 RepID=O58278_PYRHO|nr:hypothetical protein [Pyrococcus horikoshii]BAA29632.1 318aa long hypothetical protein [Pyrococcus horikoshii OT3]HII60885.1 hypothetical protein [Pyrococcus horikoshii]